MGFAVFCDFDETITRCNVTDTVLEMFADPVWLVAYAALFGLLIDFVLSWRGNANTRALNLSS